MPTRVPTPPPPPPHADRTPEHITKLAPTPHPDPTDAPTPPPARHVDASAVRAKADALYQKKQFRDASAVIHNAQASLSADDAKDLKTLSGGVRRPEPYVRDGTRREQADRRVPALQSATSFDRSAGGTLIGELQSKDGAAGAESRGHVHGEGPVRGRVRAVRAAEAGGTERLDDAVRHSLEGKAGELYAAAQADMDANPELARAEIARIKAWSTRRTPGRSRLRSSRAAAPSGAGQATSRPLMMRSRSSNSNGLSMCASAP